MMLRISILLIIVLGLSACAIPRKPQSPEPGVPDSLAGDMQIGVTPFVGMGLSDAEEGGALVLGTIAGPAAIAGLLPGDRIVRIDDIEVDGRGAHAVIMKSPVGTRLQLHVMRAGVPIQSEIVIGSTEQWYSPAFYPAQVPYSELPQTQAVLTGTDSYPDPVIEEALAEAPEIAPINRRLDRMFLQLAQDDLGYHKLPLIRSALTQPGAMTDWRNDLLSELEPSGYESEALFDVMCETLALTCTGSTEEHGNNPNTIGRFAANIASANQIVRNVFGVARAQAIADMHYLLETTAADRTLNRQPDALRGIRAMQLSMRVDLGTLLKVADQLLVNAQLPPDSVKTDRKIPVVLRSATHGEIVDFVEIDGGFVVIGGSGPNRYDMDQIHAVIDTGGEDVYRWGNGVPLETQTVIDLAGNDRYEASRAGPAAGWLGVSVLIDRAGDDHYESALGGCGAGALGFGLLFDDAGADTYQCAAWSVGSAFYGGGVLIDRGTEADAYLSRVFSQGVGGPRAFGLLLDAAGGDLYRANGPGISAYDTPATYMAFSQGVGVGIRPYDFGGVGVLIDLAGDDRYEGGEFSQGGGYLWGLGFLHDASGDDLYYGNRYAQGFAAHQAFGMLSDMSGDDIYWAMSAAGQAAAWDQSIAMLFDGNGNDLYRSVILSQGAAAQQSRASLHDVAGNDVYQVMRDASQGDAGDNAYHFNSEDPIYSIGVLLDEAGSDRYSTGLQNGETQIRSTPEGAAKGKGVAGVAMDRE